jgi:hypothetical protein
MEETITTYGKDSINQLLALLPPVHLIMTILTSWLFLPMDKNLKLKQELIIHFYNALFWAGILVIYNIFVSKENVFEKVEGITSMSISLLLSYTIASVFNIKFRTRIFKRKNK